MLVIYLKFYTQQVHCIFPNQTLYGFKVGNKGNQTDRQTDGPKTTQITSYTKETLYIFVFVHPSFNKP